MSLPSSFSASLWNVPGRPVPVVPGRSSLGRSPLGRPSWLGQLDPAALADAGHGGVRLEQHGLQDHLARRAARETGAGLAPGPRIGPEPIPLSALIAYVREPAREMPPYSEKVVSDKDLADIYEFLKSLPHPSVASSNPLLR